MFVIINILSVLFECIILVIYFSSIATTHKSKKLKILGYGAFLIGYSLISNLINISIITALSMLILCFVLSLLYDLSWIKRILFSVIITLIFILTEMLWGFIISAFGSASVEEVRKNVYLYLLGAMGSKLIALMLVMILKTFCTKQTEKMPKGIYPAIIILPIATFFIILSATELLYKSSNNSLSGIMAVGIFGVILSNFMLMIIIERSIKNIIEQNKRELENQSLIQQKKYYEDLIDRYKFSNKQLHDIDMQLAVLKNMVASENKGSGKEIDKALAMLDNAKSVQTTGIASIDAILSEIQNMISDKDINFESHIFMDKIPMENEMDFCLLLGNLLKNAVEACNRLKEGEKFIHCEIKRHNHYLQVFVENSADGKSIDKTSKHNEYKHGYGLQIIQEIVNKYNGNYSVEYKNRKYQSTILIQI